MARSHSSLVAALLASSVLHGLLFWWAASSPARITHSSAMTTQVVELDIQERQRPPEPRPASPAPAPPEGQQEKRRRPPPGPRAPPASPRQDTRESLASDLPIRDPSPSLQLLPPPPRAREPSPGGESLKPAHGPRQQAEVVDEMLRGYVAESRAKTGAVHTYFSQLADTLLAAWRAMDTRARRKSGRPCEAEVRLVLAPSGHLSLASLLFPSCDPLMDEELLTDLRANSYPAPPPEVLANREDVRSVFRFAFHPPPKLPSLRFDVTDLVDRKAIPNFEPRRVTLVRVE